MSSDKIHLFITKNHPDSKQRKNPDRHFYKIRWFIDEN